MKYSVSQILLTLLLLIMMSCTTVQRQKNVFYENFFSIEDNRICIYSAEITDTIHIILLSDTHLSMKDEREEPYEQYSKRMSGAYNITKHYKTGENTCPQEAFIETVEIASSQSADLLALTGDIFSYPSEATIEWVDSVLDASKLKYAYTTGNHDWHYEGMPGTSEELRETWINNRLLPLYKGENPLFYAVDVKGIRVVMIDNSTYEISPDQLDFFRQQVKSGLPLLLMMHIPLYVRGRPVDYGCGHPKWNRENDYNYTTEKRMPWPEKGHTPVTMQFRKEVLKASNLLAVFSGHIHQQTWDVLKGLPLFVVKENASGNYFDIKIVPMGNSTPNP